MKFFI